MHKKTCAPNSIACHALHTSRHAIMSLRTDAQHNNLSWHTSENTRNPVPLFDRTHTCEHRAAPRTSLSIGMFELFLQRGRGRCAPRYCS
mmetsp:Transcript_31812/g.83145  ORF Transcript_31812/g.83145 Transcript_31812/m.83145 type:complete len:89 (-) Transcript_31812:294-560(-)